MKRLTISLTIGALVVLAVVATAAAATPAPTQSQVQLRERDTISTILGLSQAQIRELREDGLSLAQIAARQKVDPQKLVDALAAQWSVRIDVRVTNGALSATEATALKAKLATQAKAMVYQTEPGGMNGTAVGAGRGAMAGSGAPGMGQGRNGSGDGTCDGTGPHGPAGR